MAVTADKVVVELELRDGQYLARVRQNERAFTQAQGRVAQSAEVTERRVRASSAGIASALRGAAAGIAAGVSVAAITRMGDSYTQLQNRLKVTGLEGSALEKQYERLNQVATDSRSGIEETVQVYSRLRLATEGLGLTNEDVTRTTEILAKSLSASGASASETSAALLQFSQAIGSGVLQGDELRSIRENAPAVARAIAKEFGVTVGELKKLGEEGKLVSDRVITAVLNSGTEIDALFAKTEATVGNALTNLGNQLLNYVGQTDDSLSATERMAGAINLLADNLDKVVPVITTLVTLIGARYVGALISAGVASLGTSVTLGALARQSVKNTGIALAHAEAELVRARAVAAASLASGTFAGAQTGVVAAQAAVTGATAANTAAVAANTGGKIAATGAARAWAGALALAGGPIGLATIAVAGLAAGIFFLIQRQSDAAVAARAQAKAQAASAPAATEIERLTKKLATANDEDTASIRRNIAAIIDRERIRARLARSALLEEQARERVRQQQINETARTSGAPASAFVDAYGRPTVRQGGVGPNGNPIDIARETDRIRELRAEADATDASLAGLLETTQESTAAAAAAAAESAKGPKGPSAETLARRAEQIRRRQEDVAADEALAIAQARNDTDAILRLERENEIRTRQRDIIDAGTEGLIEARTVQQALTEATEAQGRIDEARAEGLDQLLAARKLERDILIAEIDENSDLLRRKQREAERQELINSYKSEGRDITTATSLAESDLLEIEQARADANARRLADAEREDALTIARINAVTEADRQRIKDLEDQEEILRRIALYTSAEGGNMMRADAESRARREVGAIRSATDQSEVRANADLAAKTFIDALRSGDVWEALGQRFADAAADNLQKVLSTLFQQLASKDGGFFQDVLKFTASSFGGGRALGGPVRAGFSYDVGENGREKFVAPANGYIIPNVATANARSMGGGGMAFNYAPVYQVSGYGQDIEALKQQMAADRRGFKNNVAAAVNDGVQRRKIRSV